MRGKAGNVSKCQWGRGGRDPKRETTINYYHFYRVYCWAGVGVVVLRAVALLLLLHAIDGELAIPANVDKPSLKSLQHPRLDRAYRSGHLTTHGGLQHRARSKHLQPLCCTLAFLPSLIYDYAKFNSK